MKNYCARIKRIVKNYFDDKKNLLEKKERNAADYSPARASALNAPIDDEINEKLMKAIEDINSIFTQAKRALGYADLRRGEELADPDIQSLTNSILPPTVFDLRNYIDKHQTHFTALKAIKSWLQQQESMEFIELAHHFLTPYEAILRCQEYAETALKKLSAIRGAQEMYELTVENFLRDAWTQTLVTEISSVALDITKPISENQYGSFDDITLTTVCLDDFIRDYKRETDKLKEVTHDQKVYTA